ncbi:MAG: hypothetical protein WAN03_17135, partial [Candidatus Sulfotelmatobacter sp.]
LKNLWVEIVAIGTAGALALALLVATLGAATAGFAEPEPVQAGSSQQVFDGTVECSKCGAKHSSTMAKNAADCVRICAHVGAAFTLVDGEKVYQLEGDTNILKQLATRRVHVVGEAQGNTIRISSIAPTD